MFNIVGERERPNLGFASDVNVPSAHSFPFVKQGRATRRRYIRTVYSQNGEQVSRTNGPYFTLSARLSWSTRQLAWQ